MSVLNSEQRQQRRSRDHVAHGLKIHCYGRAVPAMLVDVSPGGLGVEMFVPLSTGSVVSFAGELENPGFCFALSGTARVAHCLPHSDGLYRVGLVFQNVSYRTFTEGPSHH